MPEATIDTNSVHRFRCLWFPSKMNGLLNTQSVILKGLLIPRMLPFITRNIPGRHPPRGQTENTPSHKYLRGASARITRHSRKLLERSLREIFCTLATPVYSFPYKILRNQNLVPEKFLVVKNIPSYPTYPVPPYPLCIARSE